MIGAIAGDIIGSVYEANNIKTVHFPLFSPGSRFTDDTVLTVAVADSILHRVGYAAKLKEYYRYYPHAGYGWYFQLWASSESSEPYNSWGNGSAMRVSPVGYAFHSVEDVLAEAKRSAEVTHNHIEGIKGAQATAAAIFLARSGRSKQEIRKYIEKICGYNLSEPLDSIRAWYTFDVSCQGSVPQAITAFLESESFEDAVRKAISIGGDSDTIACIAGGIAQAFYQGVPVFITSRVRAILDDRLNRVVEQFAERYSC
ncbi:MAG: ADP-ribosylglycohydrolase family protein [Deltaproteobacteria bacterium]